MKQIPSDKYNIAWFTLAECVSRGEKVRALSLYRLLVHSISDQAFTSQLKGDLLLVFQDTTAAELYEKAAELYLKDNRLLEAVGVFEHLLSLDPEKYQYIKVLIKLYKKLGIQSKVNAYLNQLFDSALAGGDIDATADVLEQIEANATQAELEQAYQQYVQFLFKQKELPIDTIILYGKKAIDQFLLSENDKQLQQFLTTIEVLNNECYLELCRYLETIYDYSKE